MPKSSVLHEVKSRYLATLVVLFRGGLRNKNERANVKDALHGELLAKFL